ncbi:hypothetical protein BK133_24440 [Paenibacillus sp. FSL H8-0548]|uniref:hypothetical protein n=1 Tax=Paenibacillus sp. FSL H8-0548 TaxID=1920422 RepID=UPI00096EB2CF|nr:hypothetical protein [Paenibacillus sp. FSL H8-0548]OMF23442.1 hypothetical protein BK133_24440 [Paenibacillus sp. FSL H8-0548]
MDWIWMISVFCSLVLLYLLYRKRQEEERGLFVKLLLYSFLGAFYFSIDELRLPVGYAVCLLLLARVRPNKAVKHLACFLGLLFFIFQFFIPAVENAWFERPKSIAASVDNWYSQNLNQMWISLEEEIGMQNAHLESFQVAYQADGYIEQLHFIVVQQKDGFIYSDIQLNKQKSQLLVKQHKIDGPWHQYERSIEAHYFFAKLDSLDRAQIKPESETELSFYTLTAHDGEFSTYAIKETEKYGVKGNQVIPITNDQLPVTGFWLAARGLENSEAINGKDSSEHQADFFFDYRFEQ